MSRHGYHGDGSFGRLCVVVPGHDLVAAVTGAHTRAQAVLDAIWERLHPVDGGWLLRFTSSPDAQPFDAQPFDAQSFDAPSFDLEAGYGEWRESAPLGRPVVATGAWQGTTFVAELYVITTSHRVRLVVEADAGIAVATWNIVPLTSPSLALHLRSPLMTRPDVA
jgi:hypothetical protein